MNTIAIIQARMGSTRLPGKMMIDLVGKPVVAHVIERVRQSKLLSDVVLATTTDPSDDILATWAEKNNISCFRGSVTDVLDRYYQAAREYRADCVVRVTGDCPLADTSVIDAVIEKYVNDGVDYTSNVHPPTFPDGLDIEVFSFAALERAWQEAKLPSEREHVTPYIWKHPELFVITNHELRIEDDAFDLSSHRWTLDTPEDLEFLRRVMAVCDTTTFLSTLGCIGEHPEWQTINAMHGRNEGYIKSVSKD